MIHWTALGFVVFLGSLFLVSRGLAAVLKRIDAGFTAIGLVQSPLNSGTLVVAYAGAVVAGPGQLAASAVGSTVVAVVVNALVTSVVAVAGLVIVRRNFGPVAEACRPGTYTLPDRFRRRHQRTVFAVLFALAIVAETIRLGVVDASGAWFVMAGAVAWTVYTIQTLYIRLPSLNSGLVRDPTEEERERIESCYERFDRSPGRIVIVAEEAKLDLNVGGRGAYHSVGVTESFLERVDDTTLAVALALVDERSANGYWTTTIWLVTVPVLGLVLMFFVWPAFFLGLFTISGPLFWGVLPLFFTVPLLSWRARRIVYDADAFVASQFDPSTIAEVYPQLGTNIQFPSRSIGLFDRLFDRLFWPDATFETRLKRLGIEPASGDTAEQTDGETQTAAGDTDGETSTDAGDTDGETSTDAGDTTQTTREDQSQPDQDESTDCDPGTGWRRWILATTVLATLSVVAFVTATILIESGATGTGLGPLTVVLLVTTMVTGLTSAVTWLLIPFFIYLDSKTTQLVTDWPSHRLLYLVAALVPLLNLLVGAVYLWRRPSLASNGETAESTE
ncbi:hypothetical protein [Haloarcula salinisoli]|uniref:Zn-dependent protease with chaperone function n=1 Tax=Haloarcula salinisoli TaxID=2487746 RepID=A0A8J7YBC7_9EURY|nr:hypothetical protein [Halomicroarcula salinisoli]MBX0285601.1 hypothetical protein [Halomicroarcula salinisoli]MBX0302910.1 hypothetical protein [Halomicroarcula salinisoli]